VEIVRRNDGFVAIAPTSGTIYDIRWILPHDGRAETDEEVCGMAKGRDRKAGDLMSPESVILSTMLVVVALSALAGSVVALVNSAIGGM
jgi:hypothetical protein